jgi:hypothetical protein
VLLTLTVASGCGVLVKDNPPCSFRIDARQISVDTTLAVGEVARFYALKGEPPLVPLDEEKTLADFPDDPDAAPYLLNTSGGGVLGVAEVTPGSQRLQPDSEVRVEAESPGSGNVTVRAFDRTDGCEGSDPGTVIEVEVVEAGETP